MEVSMYASVFDLTEKVAIVTGGASGIGRTLAQALAEAGASVLVGDIDLPGAARTVEEIASRGRNGRPLKMDVTRVEDVEKVVQVARGEFGGLDILVNSGGVNVVAAAIEFPEEEWDRIIDTNLKGTFLCCQAAGKVMIPQGSGNIVNIASQLGFVGFRNRAPYCASKGGVIQLTRALAVEWAPHNVKVNAIAPTFTTTPSTATALADRAFRNEVESTIPLGRIGHPDDLVGGLLFLVSEASDFVTGHILVVDGGRTAR
jgi:NAD(P)-dependent dehydrogenase (short-subunit alcohol dehydrogenase family)